MAFPSGFVEEVRAASNIVAVVGAFVNLKKAGQSWKGLCPFHGEKTPSFNVNAERGFFHCFGCQQSGDVFKFVMLYDRVGFPEAVRKVATLSGVPLPQESRSPGEDRRERLFAINEEALKLYRATLAGPRGAAGRAYLERRGIRPETSERFELGLTPEGWEGISAPLLKAGFRAEDLVSAGLAKQRPSGRGIHDRFFERLIFPIRGPSGRLLGFGGRSLSGQEPKYLNSPETELYSKSEVLYGLNLAKEALRRTGRAILVEGYIDLVALHQAGFEETVASLGTSLTERHAALLGRHVRRVALCYDGDAAGRNASKRALRALLAERLEIGVVELDAGVDPDDAIRAEGEAGFRARLERAEGCVPFLARLVREAAGAGADAAQVRVRLVQEAMPLLQAIPDPVERAVHARALAERAGVDDEVVLQSLARAPAPAAAPPVLAATPPSEASPAEILFLAALLAAGESAPALLDAADPADFEGLPSAPVVAAAREARDVGEAVDAAAISRRLSGRPGEALVGRVMVDGPSATASDGLKALLSLREVRLRRELRRVQAGISAASGEELDALLARKQALSRELEALRRS